MRLQFKLTAQEFVPFQNAALDYRQAEGSIQDRLAVTEQADRASHPGTKRLSSEAKARTHGFFAELAKDETDAIDSIHRALDAPAAQRMDEAVASFFEESLANRPIAAPRGSANNLPGLTLDASTSASHALSAVSPDLTNGGDNCEFVNPDEEQDEDDECTDEGGVYNVEDCECGGGGGGGEPPAPTITSISPSTVLVGADSVQVTISGTGFGFSPTVNLPSGVTSSGQTSTNFQIVITLSIGNTATVGNNGISVTANGQNSNVSQVVLDGPYQMVVVNDTSFNSLGSAHTRAFSVIV